MKFIPKSSISFVIIFFAFTLSAIGQINNGRNQVWKPVEVNGERVIATNAFIDFDRGGRRFTGNTGCNTMSGTVTLGRGNRIDLAATAVTKRACKMMEGSLPEVTFLKALEQAVRYRRDGRSLDLFDRRGRRVTRFALTAKDTGGQVSPGKALTDRKWALESIGGRMTLVAIKGVFLNFEAQKKSAGGDTGCNVFGGSYTATDRTISITNIISTMRACEEDGKMQLEREFLDGLRRADRYEIKDGHLHLFARNKALMTFRGEPK